MCKSNLAIAKPACHSASNCISLLTQKMYSAVCLPAPEHWDAPVCCSDPEVRNINSLLKHLEMLEHILSGRRLFGSVGYSSLGTTTIRAVCQSEGIFSSAIDMVEEPEQCFFPSWRVGYATSSSRLVPSVATALPDFPA